MKNKAEQFTPEQKLKALYEKAGRPTLQMKQELNKAFGLLNQDEMKDFDTEDYKTKAWRK